MDDAVLGSLAVLVGGADAGGAGLDPASRMELDLWLGKAWLKQGALDRAAAALTAAGSGATDAAARGVVAEHWLALAKAWGKAGAGPDSTAAAEAALRQALELAPAQAAPVYAQYLQRQKRLPEAVALWREAVRLNRQEASHLLSLARLLEQSGQAEAALDAYLEAVEVTPSGKNYLLVAQRLEGLAAALPPAPAQRSVRIALLGNATLDHLRSYVTVACYQAGLRPTIYQGGFDQYVQEILNPHSDLYTFAPEVVVCAIHASRLFPQLHDYPFDLPVAERQAAIEQGLATVQTLLDTLTQRSPALVLFHNMVLPQHPALGILDLADAGGQTESFSEINRRLAELARTRYKNVYVVDEDRLQARCGKARATDPRLWFTARMGWSEAVLPLLAHEYTRYLRPLKGLSRKCIVLDLDNTLWGGVIGEDGLAGIQLGSDAPGNAFVAFQRELEKLWRRGILLAICSKNNPDDALAVFAQHPGMHLQLSHFAAQRINWEPKAANIRAIAAELNLGLDSLVFLDDNPVERARVRAELPQVLTPEWPADAAAYRQALLELTVFDTLALTEEDRNRNQLYAAQKARQALEAQYSGGDSLDQYLADLQMVVEIAPATSLTLPRIAQLTNKTNQFNLTTRRYSEAQIDEMLARGWRVYSMRVTDRFGDNGLVGVAIVAPVGPDAWELDTLLLSCRVMGRGVETALLAFVGAQARQAGVGCVRGWYVPTAKNAPVADCYRQHGFTQTAQEPDGSTCWTWDLRAADLAVPAWLTVTVAEAVAV
jgi:FkbH-like protein